MDHPKSDWPEWSPALQQAAAAVAGGASYALLLPEGTSKRRLFVLGLIGAMVAFFVSPWLSDVVGMTSEHARSGVAYLSGLLGTTAARSIIHAGEVRGETVLARVLSWVLGPTGDESRRQEPPKQP